MNSDLRIVSSKDRCQGHCLLQTDTSEGLTRVLEGFYSWRKGEEGCDTDGLAKNREKRKRWKLMMAKKIYPSHSQF
jgi:hypothetical protein